MWSPLFYNWFIRQHERKRVSSFCQNVIGFDDEHEKKKQCLSSGEWLVGDESALSLRYSLIICAFYISDLMFSFLRPCVDWVFYFPTHSMAFKIKVTAARLTPHWWAPLAPRGCGSHSQRHPRWRSLRCCRQNPPSSRNHHNRQPEINIKVVFLF